MKHKVLMLCLILPFLSCSRSTAPLSTVDALDLNRYAGKWYEIARLPNSFEKGLEKISATYSLRPDGKVDVLNQGQNGAGEWKSAKGIAWIPDSEFPSRLKVSFFWPFAGKYWVLALDPDYRLALVGHPNRKYLWILGRESLPDRQLVDQYLMKASEMGFDTASMVWVRHD